MQPGNRAGRYGLEMEKILPTPKRSILMGEKTISKVIL